MSVLLALRGLRKSYAARRVLNIDVLAIEPGRSYVLTGDNGSGKTTLLRILAGLESAQAAHGEFLGREFSLASYPEALRREIIYVHQHPYLFRTTLAANIAYGLETRGVNAAEREHKVRDAIEWAGVGHLGRVPPHKLSGGEAQRVALARAKVLRPRLFLLDEPTANLDYEGRQQVMALIAQLGKEDNSIVIACHDREIVELPDVRRLHLEQGRIVPA